MLKNGGIDFYSLIGIGVFAFLFVFILSGMKENRNGHVLLHAVFDVILALIPALVLAALWPAVMGYLACQKLNK